MPPRDPIALAGFSTSHVEIPGLIVLSPLSGGKIFNEKSDAAVARFTFGAVDKAMEAAGGAAFYRTVGLQRRFRDMQVARYHPLQEKAQLRYAGRIALGLAIDG